MQVEVKPANTIGNYAAIQSITEIGLGSILHALHVPFAGHFLSLNQGFLLTFSIKKATSTRQAIHFALSISIIASLLKSLSPIGKRLTPMLAISMQGFLFSLGLLLGKNCVGASLGMVLLSLWGFIQPLLIAYFIFGEKLFLSVQKLWLDIATFTDIPPTYGLWIIAFVVTLKVMLGVVITVFAWRSNLDFENKYINKLTNIKPPSVASKTVKKPWLGALQDSLSPWVLLSLLLSLSFMWINESSTFFQLWIYALRVMAIAWLFFWVVRVFPVAWAKENLEKYPAAKIAVSQIYKFFSRN